jgi:hypothetical protein
MKKSIPNPGSDAAAWHPVLGYEDRYIVSSSGDVVSLNWEGSLGRRKPLQKNIRKGPRNSVGYYTVRLHRNKTVRTATCGRLVLEAFLGPCPIDHEVNHKNGNTLDDGRENLEWVTRSENQKHAVANGLARYPINPKTSLDAGQKYYWVHTSGLRRWATPMSMSREFLLDPSYLYRMAGGVEHHLSFKGWKTLPAPNPGSDAAFKVSCLCPRLDNGYGIESRREFNGWVIVEGCPVHDPEKTLQYGD